MKKKTNNKGFALVETLVCVLFVAVIFLILFENYMPLVAKYKRTENYDDLDSKYIAYYVKTFIEADSSETLEHVHNLLPAGNTIYVFKRTDNTDTDISLNQDENKKTFELCTILQNNKQKCQDFMDDAEITKVYLVDYKTINLKNKIAEGKEIFDSENKKIEISRSFELYVKDMPKFEEQPESKSGYKRLIVEIEHKKENEEKYYTYSNIELRK